RRYVAERKAHRNCAKWTVRMLWIQRIVETLDMLAASDFDLVVDPRSLRNPEDDVPQDGPSHPPHRQPGRQAENSLGEVHLVGLTPEEESAVATFDDRNFATCEEAVHCRFVDRALLLKLVDGEATRAASGRPIMTTPSGVTHCAYTWMVRLTSSSMPRNAS